MDRKVLSVNSAYRSLFLLHLVLVFVIVLCSASNAEIYENEDASAVISKKSSTYGADLSNPTSAASAQAMQNAAAQRGATQLNADISAQSMDKRSAQSARSASTDSNPSNSDRENNRDNAQELGSQELSDADLMFEFEGVEDKRSVVRQGKVSLKRFGYDFFTKRGRMQADPLSQVGPDYVVGPGDTLKIDMWGSIEGHYTVTVDRNGDVVLPQVGVVNVWGQNFTQARQTIKDQIFKLFSNLNVNITMGSLRSIQVFIVGEVNNPGTYTLSSLSTVLTALSQVGGPSPRGSLRNIELRRQGEVVAQLDFYDLLLSGDNSEDARLQSGDTIFVPITNKLVGVAGDVRRPAVYELKDEHTIQDVLQLAGGVIPTAYMQKVQVARVKAHESRVVLDLDLSDLTTGNENFTLQDRDFINVAPISDAGGYVELSGYVTRPGKYEWTPGMRLTDIILPYDNLMPDFYPERAQIVRMSPPLYRKEMITVELAKALEGDKQENILLQEYDIVTLYSRDDMEEYPYVKISGSVNRPGEYRIYDGMTLKDLVVLAGNPTPRAALDNVELKRVNYREEGAQIERMYIDLRQALSDGNNEKVLLQRDDHIVVHNVPIEEDVAKVRVSGAVFNPGEYTLIGNMRVRDLLIQAGNLRRRASREEAELTRFIRDEDGTKVERIMLDLQELLAGNQEKNILLHEDDHLFVRTMPDYNEKRQVVIEGEVLYPGIYAIGVGETLSSVLERAGGYTQESYLRGAMFKRESLKKVQQQRVDKLIAEQESEILRLEQELAAGAMDEADLQAAQQTIKSRREALTRLKAANASGRMVVHLQPLDELRDSMNDVLLMDGDHLVIPEDPQSVSVLGEVYNPTSLAYRPGKTVKHYLDKVGGVTGDAEEEEMFLVRADGTVVSYAQQSGFGLHWDFDNYRWIWGGFNSMIMHPGDTLLVPEDMDQTDWIKEGKDISQILYQIALGAAAVASF
jgi:protein involved in polysaccharide export with SLBB domain